MPMVIIGVLLLVVKLAEFGPFANMSWWIVAAPFAAAVLWWNFADNSGLTKKREIDKMEQRKVDRRANAMEALGMSTRRVKQATRATQDKARRLAESADPTQANYPPEKQRGEPRP